MIKIYTIKNKVKFTSEQIILFGLLDNLPKDDESNYNNKNESRYQNVIEYCKNNFEYVDNPESANILVLPYKFIDPNDISFIELNDISIKLNIPFYCFFNDDSNKIFDIKQNVKLFRTSFNSSTKLDNEYALPTISPDFFSNIFIENKELIIGYCGHKLWDREKYINIFKNNFTTKFIVRDKYWMGLSNRVKCRQEYFKNMEESLFVFCYRGNGNFSIILSVNLE